MSPSSRTEEEEEEEENDRTIRGSSLLHLKDSRGGDDDRYVSRFVESFSPRSSAVSSSKFMHASVFTVASRLRNAAEITLSDYSWSDNVSSREQLDGYLATPRSRAPSRR